MSISERSTVAGGFRPREAQPVALGAWSPEQAAWGLAVGPLGSDEILLEGTPNRLRAWAPPGVPLSGTADEALQRWRVATSPSGHAFDPAAFSDVSAVAVGEVLDAVPRTLHTWVTATTQRALARLELFLRTGMRVADRPMTTAQSSASDLRRELSEAHHSRRAPFRVSRRAFGAGEHARAALDGFVAALAHRLIAAMTADVFELSLEQQRWREHSEALHDHEIGCGSISSLATDALRELCRSSMWSRHESESLLQRYSEAMTQASSIPAAVQVKQFALGGQVFSGVSCPPSEPDERLWPDDFKRYDGRSAWESASHAFLSAARWASEGRSDSEQAERLIHRRLHGVWGERREPDPRIADYTIHVRALGAFLARHAAQSGEVSCSACEEGSDVGHRRVAVTEADGAAEALARIVGAQEVPASMVLILGSFPRTTPVSSFECDVDAGELLIGTGALDFAFDRSLHYLPKIVSGGAPARSSSHRPPSGSLTDHGSRAVARLRVDSGACGACGAPVAESTHCSAAPLSMV